MSALNYDKMGQWFFIKWFKKNWMEEREQRTQLLLGEG